MARKRKIRTTRYDAADYLKTEKDIEAYLEAALKDGDPRVIAAAQDAIQRARRKISL
jgi:probable addiction module antidote protein